MISFVAHNFAIFPVLIVLLKKSISWNLEEFGSRVACDADRRENIFFKHSFRSPATFGDEMDIWVRFAVDAGEIPN